MIKRKEKHFALETDVSVTNEFELNLENLKLDIEHIDIRLQSIQKHITVLESSISKLQHQINSNQVQNKIPYYNTYNKALEILNLFQSNYQKYLDIKFKYRKEQNDLRFRVIHMLKIDLQKLNSDNDELTTGRLIEVLQQITKVGTAVSEETQNVINQVNKDPKYEI